MRLVLLLVSVILVLCSHSASAENEQVQAGVVAAVLQQFPEVADQVEACWKDAYGRGVGKPISACAEGLEKSGLLCYPQCREGYKGVGPVCWEQCRPGFTDEGALCAINLKIISADNSACPWYDKCGLTFAKGCSKCPPDQGYVNDGCTCRRKPNIYAKKSYGRGAGKPLGCPADQEYDAGLCYPPCRAGYSGVGPVCWEQCPAELPKAALAMCCGLKGCSAKIAAISKSVIEAIIAAIGAGRDPTNAVVKILEAALGFVLPKCTAL